MPLGVFNSSTTSSPASKIAGDTAAFVCLPPFESLGGNRESPMRPVTLSRPSISAATTCTTGREPVPGSCVPTRTSIVPSALT